MFPYILIILFLFVTSFIYDILCHNKGKVQLESIALISLILMAGLRYHIGGDTMNYIEAFEETPKLNEWELGEGNIKYVLQPLWSLSMSICKTIYDDFVLFQILVAVVINILIFSYIKRCTDKIFTVMFVSFFIVWIYYNFETVREAVCIGIYLNSLMALKEGKVKKYLLLNLPSLFIHYFSVLIIIATLVFYKMSLKTVILLCVVFSAFFLLLDTKEIQDNVFGLFLLAGDNFGSLSEKYMESEEKGFSNLNIFGIISVIIYFLLPLIIAISLSKKNGKLLEAKLAWFFTLLFIATAKLQILNRFENYLWIFLICEVVNYLFASKRTLAYYVVLFVLCMNVWKYVNYFYKPSPGQADMVDYDYRYIPYKTVFEEPDKFRENMYEY